VKILIVDDEQLDLFISKKLLGLEYTVEGFHTISETLLWIKENQFDVLLSDYYLDKGVDAHRVLKEILSVKDKTFKAFVLSSHVDGAQAQELKASGYDGVIEKPLSLEKFRSAVTGT
jgi:DNA-binding NtrC family response regulator